MTTSRLPELPIRRPPKEADPRAPFLLEARTVRVHPDGDGDLAGVDLTVAPGDLVWVSGPSGSGKTTLLRTLARLRPSRGTRLLLQGTPCRAIPPHRWRARVAMLPAPPVSLGTTVGEDLRAPFRLGVRRNTSPPTDRVLREELDALGLEDVALERSTAELSLGQRFRVAFLRTVLAGPLVLLLDEPGANLDAGAEERVAARLKRFLAEGRGAVVAGHGTPWPDATRRYRLENGRLAEDRP